MGILFWNKNTKIWNLILINLFFNNSEITINMFKQDKKGLITLFKLYNN